MTRRVKESTPAAEVERRIVAAMRGRATYRNPWPLSTVGYAAFPDANFKAQGAAFAVARIAHDMQKRGVLRWTSHPNDGPRGYYLP